MDFHTQGLLVTEMLHELMFTSLHLCHGTQLVCQAVP